MRRIPFLLGVAAGLTAWTTAGAIDVNPSKNTQPPAFWDSGSAMGSRFSIFNGDPKRIQRANEVDAKAFDSKIEVTPNPLSLKTVKAAAPNPSIKVTFYVHNHGKKTYTLSFPTAQRWDFRIVDAAGAPVYVYSDNCQFEQTIGSSMVNHDDKLVYSETISFDDLNHPLAPGTYKVQALLANYPEMHAEAQFVVQP